MQSVWPGDGVESTHIQFKNAPAKNLINHLLANGNVFIVNESIIS